MATGIILRWLGTSAFVAGLLNLPASAARPALAGQVSAQQQGSQAQQSLPAQPGAQAQTNAQPPGPDPKTKKVWTNDNIVSLRTPADIYQVEKESQEAAAAQAAAEAEAKKGNEPGPTIALPATAEDTQKLIQLKESQIEDEQTALERLIKDLPNTPEDKKAAMEKEIDRVASDLPVVRNELKMLHDHLDALAKAPLNEPTASPAAPPPS